LLIYLTGIYNAPLGLVKKIRYYLFLSNDLGYGKTDELEKDLRVIETSLRAYRRKNERLNKGKN
jgi:hypothetical protein